MLFKLSKILIKMLSVVPAWMGL